MKRPLTVLLLCLLAGMLAWWRLRDNRVAESGQASTAPATAPVATPNPASQPTASTPNAASSSDDGKSGPSLKRAYLLSLDQGALALVQAQDIEGDFAPRRGKDEEWTGMLRCRLMSETNDVLAEELLPAPDQVCMVLDPRSTTAAPVNFTNPGPILFQVRLPRVKEARRLDIFRILQPGVPATENLLGSLTLPPP